MYTLKGSIKLIGDVEQISDSFKKRELVVTDSSGKYEQHVSLQLTQDRVDVVNDFKVGDEVEVTFFLRGREWTNPKSGEVRYFNSLDVWKVESLGKDSASSVDTVEKFVAEGDDDLPF